MIFFYLLLNSIYIIFSLKLFKKAFNPISIYSAIWVLVVSLYELKLVHYYDLTMYTWLIIILFQLLYNIGCVFGGTLKLKSGSITILKTENYASEKELKKTIIILTSIAAIGIISNVLIGIRQYGFNLLQFTNQLYVARLQGDIETGIPYLGSFIYPALILEGYYLSKYKFKKFLLIPVILLMLNALKSAGRLGIVQGLFFVLVPILLNRVEKKQKNKTRKNNKSKIWIFITIGLFVVIFAVISMNKSTWITINPYMSPLMIKLVEYEPAIYKTYIYVTTPIGVLNEFLKDPTFNFGGHTFLTVYNFLNKIGFDIPVEAYQQFYTVPIRGNVGSYIRELIEDFGVVLALATTFLTGIIYSYSYKKYLRTNSFTSLIWMTTYSFIIIFSFFMWQIRSSSTWILLIIGTIVAYILDRNESKRRWKHEYNNNIKLQ